MRFNRLRRIYHSIIFSTCRNSVRKDNYDEMYGAIHAATCSVECRRANDDKVKGSINNS